MQLNSNNDLIHCNTGRTFNEGLKTKSLPLQMSVFILKESDLTFTIFFCNLVWLGFKSIEQIDLVLSQLNKSLCMWEMREQLLSVHPLFLKLLLCGAEVYVISVAWHIHNIKSDVFWGSCQGIRVFFRSRFSSIPDKGKPSINFCGGWVILL